jgi:hypothetical protein
MNDEPIEGDHSRSRHRNQEILDSLLDPALALLRHRAVLLEEHHEEEVLSTIPPKRPARTTIRNPPYRADGSEGEITRQASCGMLSKGKREIHWLNASC